MHKQSHIKQNDFVFPVCHRSIYRLLASACVRCCCLVKDSEPPDENVGQSHSSSDRLIITCQLTGVQAKRVLGYQPSARPVTPALTPSLWSWGGERSDNPVLQGSRTQRLKVECKTDSYRYFSILQKLFCYIIEKK